MSNKQIILVDSDVQAVIPTPVTVFNNSQTLIKFRAFNGKPRPLDLTNYKVGVYLFNSNGSLRRPANKDYPPNSKGFETILATEGLFKWDVLPSDFTHDDRNLSLRADIFASKFVTLNPIAMEAGGSLTVGNWTALVTANLPEGETHCDTPVTFTITTDGPRTVNFSWGSVTGATNYRLYMRLGTGSWNFLTTTETSAQVDGAGDLTGSGAPPSEDLFRFLVASLNVGVR